MINLTAIPERDALEPRLDRSRRNFRHIRVLRWIFRRGSEDAVVCELALTGEDREYELRVSAAWNPTGLSVERFDDALTAFQRHAMIERQLLDAGWALDGFESERVTVH
jgi:hypothetical protein